MKMRKYFSGLKRFLDLKQPAKKFAPKLLVVLDGPEAQIASR
jgi:hypothetical protein